MQRARSAPRQRTSSMRTARIQTGGASEQVENKGQMKVKRSALKYYVLSYRESVKPPALIRTRLI